MTTEPNPSPSRALPSETTPGEFTYSPAFVERIRAYHEGMESRPQFESYVSAQLGGPESRVALYARELVPEIEYHCGPLRGRRVLDCGCGTGATTVNLAARGATVVAFDIDPRGVEICRYRVEEHGLADRVERFVRADSIDAVAEELGRFDVVLMNGVIEHVPASIPGLRGRVLRSAFERVRPGGFLYISDTPNRLIPYDSHTTGLWGIPWTRPGSARAHRRAIVKGRYAPAPSVSEGPLGLEEEGAWGATYWEIRRHLDAARADVVNLEPGHDRRLTYTDVASWKRGLAERLIHATATRWLRIPVLAFFPYLDHLVLRRRAEHG